MREDVGATSRACVLGSPASAVLSRDARVSSLPCESSAGNRPSKRREAPPFHWLRRDGILPQAKLVARLSRNSPAPIWDGCCILSWCHSRDRPVLSVSGQTVPDAGPPRGWHLSLCRGLVWRGSRAAATHLCPPPCLAARVKVPTHHLPVYIRSEYVLQSGSRPG